MMSCFLPKSDTIPLTKLPYDFQRRLITLAPPKNINNLSKVCPKFKTTCRLRPRAYDHVFITDDDNVCRWASKNTFDFKIFKFLYQFAFIKYVFDGYRNVNPAWQAVLCVDEIVERKQQIYVEDTLILNCTSINSCETVIPNICGPYTRLILHGNVNLDQLIRLMHPGVKKVRIHANIEMPTASYDYFADLVVKQVRGYNSCFVLRCIETLTPQLQVTLYEACQRYHHSFFENSGEIAIREQNVSHLLCYYVCNILFFCLCDAMIALFGATFGGLVHGKDVFFVFFPAFFTLPMFFTPIAIDESQKFRNDVPKVNEPV